LTIGTLLVLSFLTDTALTIIATFLQSILPDFFPTLRLVNQAFTFGIITLLFTLVYKILPEVEVAWRDVIPGAVLAATLLSLARYVLTIYLSQSGVVSAYGAAGSVIVLLLWIYFAAQIMLYGAEFGEVYANKFGSRSMRERGDEERQTQGQSQAQRRHPTTSQDEVLRRQ
jgi:membrane protein